MSENSFFLKGKIKSLRYNKTAFNEKLSLYDFDKFDINKSKSYGIINKNGDLINYSKWISPKRTRSYPFSRIYKVYGTQNKVITIIPIIKDEGVDGDLDRINYITLSWMNLMGVYIILAWYESARKNTRAYGKQKIINENLDLKYIKDKIDEIYSYKYDAHHWNNQHFQKDFCYVYKNAQHAYSRISKELNISLHDDRYNSSFLNNIRNDDLLDLEKFKEITLYRSKLAAYRESCTVHELEKLTCETSKGIFEIENNLGGKYYITSDEIIIENGHIIIQESKNATKSTLPSLCDIQDGLFKILLFSQLNELFFRDKKVKYKVRLRLTGKIKKNLILPITNETILHINNLTKKDIETLKYLNEEAVKNNFLISVESDYDD